MKKIVTIVIIAVVSLGVILAGTGLILTEGDFTKPFTRIEKTIDETRTVTSLGLNITADNVEFYPSADGLLHIEYWDCDTNPFVYTYLDGVVELKEAENYFSRFSQRKYNSKTVKVYIPSSLSDTLTVSLSSGNLNNYGSVLHVENLNIDMYSGNVNLDNITAENIYVDMSIGHFNISNCQINGILDIELSCGDINLQDSYVEALKTISSGEVSSNGLKTTSVNIITSVGDINLHLIGDMQDYTLNLTNSNIIYVEDGDEHIKAIDWLQWDENKYVIGTDGEYHPVVEEHKIGILCGDGEYSIICENSTGNINIYFD